MQVNTRLKALDEIYKIYTYASYTLLHRSEKKICRISSNIVFNPSARRAGAHVDDAADARVDEAHHRLRDALDAEEVRVEDPDLS